MQGIAKGWKLGSWEGRKFRKNAGDDFQPVQASQLLNFVTFLPLRAGAEVDEEEAYDHRQEPQHPQVRVGGFQHFQVQGLELFRKGEIGKPLQDENHPDHTQEELQIDAFHKSQTRDGVD